ncbi:fatty acid cis/trans isomerase, partial [Vibrio parahaemolyticus]
DAGFHPFFNERDHFLAANLEAVLIGRLLQQIERHPLPDQVLLEGFVFSIVREQSCPTIEEYEQFEKDNPNWGMP